MFFSWWKTKVDPEVERRKKQNSELVKLLLDVDSSAATRARQEFVLGQMQKMTELSREIADYSDIVSSLEVNGNDQDLQSFYQNIAITRDVVVEYRAALSKQMLKSEELERELKAQTGTTDAKIDVTGELSHKKQEIERSLNKLERSINFIVFKAMNGRLQQLKDNLKKQKEYWQTNRYPFINSFVNIATGFTYNRSVQNKLEQIERLLAEIENIVIPMPEKHIEARIAAIEEKAEYLGTDMPKVDLFVQPTVKIKFWDAIFRPQALKAITRDKLIADIKNGTIIGLNDPDVVVSDTIIGSKDPAVVVHDKSRGEVGITPSQWALNKNDPELAAIIDQYAALERSQQPSLQSQPTF